MEAMAQYADILGEISQHEERSGHDHLSSQLMADMADYWTGQDTQWLLLMTDLISMRRAAAAMQRKRFRWLRKWF